MACAATVRNAIFQIAALERHRCFANKKLFLNRKFITVSKRQNGYRQPPLLNLKGIMS